MGPGDGRIESHRVKRRGRHATFPAPGDGGQETEQPTLAQESPWRFSIVVDGGATKTFDLSEWGQPAFTATVVPRLIEIVRRMGPAPLGSTVTGKILNLRRFWRFLAEHRYRLCDITEVTADMLDRYEDWLEQNTRNATHHRQILSPLIHVLRVAIELESERFAVSLMARIKYLSRVALSEIRPRDAYSGAVTASLRAAARTQIEEAQGRIVLAADFAERPPMIEAHPALHAVYDETIAVIRRDGWISSSHPSFSCLASRALRRFAGGIAHDSLHSRYYLTRVDMAGFLILLSLETGMEIECLCELKADCLRNPSRGYVEIEYRKRRAHGMQWKRLRVRDGASSTPGAIIRALIELTARARTHLDSDMLFAWWNGYRLVTRARKVAVAAMFVARHELVDDDGKPLHLVLPRLRKTQKAEHYIRTEGQLEAFATGHTIAVAARHYAEIPALRHIHEQTVADAFQDALNVALKPRLVCPQEELATITSTVDGPPVVTSNVLSGEQDVWLASCSDFSNSPFGSSDGGCATPFWGCLECANAVITARKLPALIAFDTFIVEQRTGMTEQEWRVKFGRAHHRISRQIIPAFPDAVVAEARLLAATEGSDLLYMPPEIAAT